MRSNAEVEDDFGLINEDAETNWIVEVSLRNKEEFDQLMTRSEYDQMVEEEG